MRRILVRQTTDGWYFDHVDGARHSSPSAITTSMAAMAYGESFRGQALGYIIRLQTLRDVATDETTVLHSVVFADGARSL
jgi:hypothetical protein